MAFDIFSEPGAPRFALDPAGTEGPAGSSAPLKSLLLITRRGLRWVYGLLVFIGVPEPEAKAVTLELTLASQVE